MAEIIEQTFRLRRRLPVSHYTEIGRIINSIWVYDPHSPVPVIQDFSKAYVANAEEIQPRITPLAVAVPLSKLKEIRRGIDGLANRVQQLEKLIFSQVRARRRSALRGIRLVQRLELRRKPRRRAKTA